MTPVESQLSQEHDSNRITNSFPFTHLLGHTKEMEHHMEQEAYSVYYVVTKLNYYLQGAEIIVMI